MPARKKSAPKKTAAKKQKLKRVTLDPAYEPQKSEDAIYASWEKSGFFNPDKLPGARKEPFTIIMPPPNATGTLHVGHSLFMTLQDIMTRFERMRGKAALWLPGTDHAAIATNAKVEGILLKEGTSKKEIGRKAFIERVEQFIEKSQGTIHQQIRKMGSSCDWSREAYTFDEKRSRVVRVMFKKMFDDGLIYRGYRIVNWCPGCQTTVADDEVEYKEEAATLYYIKYGPFVVATTRPETKLGDTAAAVHPDDERYKDWIGKTFEVDFGIGAQEIKVIADEGVDPKFGTGVIGVTPAHSAVDYAMAEKNDLVVKKVIGEDAKMTTLAGIYAGLPVLEARKAFVADLRAKGLIEKEEPITHNLAICKYRCGSTIEPLTSRQWFVNVNKVIPKYKKSLRQMSLEVVKKGKITILPDRFEKVYLHWMENLHDWCISRQIWFGHRVPVWYCQSCYVEETESSRAGASSREMKNHIGVIVSVETPERCPTCNRRKDLTELTQETDTLDTWFSSGTWTFSTLGWPEKTRDLKKFHPTDVLETGYDILFFWIGRMILMTTYAVGEIPFKTVYLHGLVRDEQGRKMSKSLGNIIDPIDVIAKFGTDALRLSLIVGNSPGNDLRLSEEKIAYFRNFANKLWNISRFVLLQGIAKTARAPKAKTLADKWFLHRLRAVTDEVTKALEHMQYSRAAEVLRDFTWGEFADWYLELAKVEGGKDEILGAALDTVLKLWHPFMPFVTENIYSSAFATKKNDFLMIAKWPKGVGKLDRKSEKEFAVIRDVVTAIRTIRANYKLAPSAEVKVVLTSAKHERLLKAQSATIAGLIKASHVAVAKKSGKLAQAASVVVAGVKASIPLEGLIDIAAEKEKLKKEIGETERYVASLEQKLANESFVARAPAAVVANERQKVKEHKEKIEKLREQMKSLE